MFSTSIRLPEDIRDRLERLAKKTSRSKSYYIHEAIVMHPISQATFKRVF